MDNFNKANRQVHTLFWAAVAPIMFILFFIGLLLFLLGIIGYES